MSTKTPRTLREREKNKGDASKMAAAPQNNVEVNLQALSEGMVAQISKNVTTAIDDRLIKLQVTIDGIKEAMEDHAKRLDAAEQRISLREDSAAQVDRQVAELKTLNKKLLDRIEDQENRQRRNNVRLIGVPESVRDPELLNLIEVWLPEQLGMAGEERLLKCERVHRVGQRAGADNRPRPVMARILNWNHKTALMRAYRSTKGLLYDGHKILLFQDYSAQVAGQRREMAPLCTALIKKGVSCALLFPARIRVQRNGEPMFLADKKAAQAYLASLDSPEG